MSGFLALWILGSLSGGLNYLPGCLEIVILSSCLNVLSLDSFSGGLESLDGDLDCHINVHTFCPVIQPLWVGRCRRVTGTTSAIKTERHL